jgi:hypothetical protein
LEGRGITRKLLVHNPGKKENLREAYASTYRPTATIYKLAG